MHLIYQLRWLLKSLTVKRDATSQYRHTNRTTLLNSLYLSIMRSWFDYWVKSSLDLVLNFPVTLPSLRRSDHCYKIAIIKSPVSRSIRFKTFLSPKIIKGDTWHAGPAQDKRRNYFDARWTIARECKRTPIYWLIFSTNFIWKGINQSTRLK